MDANGTHPLVRLVADLLREGRPSLAWSIEHAPHGDLEAALRRLWFECEHPQPLAAVIARHPEARVFFDRTHLDGWPPRVVVDAPLRSMPQWRNEMWDAWLVSASLPPARRRYRQRHRWNRAMRHWLAKMLRAHHPCPTLAELFPAPPGAADQGAP